MRFFSLLPLALLAACASSPKVAEMPAAPAASVPGAEVSTPDNSAPQERFATVDATNIAKAQAAGYKVVDENGQKLYCRRSLVPGTRLKYRTSCLTAEELARVNDAAREAVARGSGYDRDQLPGR